MTAWQSVPRSVRFVVVFHAWLFIVLLGAAVVGGIVAGLALALGHS